MLEGRAIRWIAPFLVAVPLALCLVEGAVRFGLIDATTLPSMVRIANKKADADGNIRPGTLALLCYPTNYRGYFRINLKEPKTFSHYESIGMRNMDKALPERPFAVEQEFNSQMYLGPEFGEKKSDVVRVVILGRSFNMGWGLRLEDRLTTRLEQALNRTQPGRYEVLNAGTSMGSVQDLTYRARELLALKPDILVYGMVLSDTITGPELKDKGIDPNAPANAEDSPRALRFFEPRLLELWRKRERDRRESAATVTRFSILTGDRNSAGVVATRQYVREMDGMMKHRGGRFVLALWPMLVPWDDGYPFKEFHDRTGGFAHDRGIEFADFLPELASRRAQELWVHPVDRHPNEIASELAAEKLARTILRN